MKIEIDPSVINQTTKCEKNFICLESNTEECCCCKVEKILSDKILFLKCLSSGYCSYAISFGNSYTCICPVRTEIYRKYKK
jgi:hypothetical protein